MTRPPVRTGIGYDSHRFAPGGPMILGGVRIPSDVVLVGHSDGDAVAHAVTDAVLGATAAVSIAIESRPRLARVRARGWQVAQVDVTVVAERPKIMPHRAAMAERLAQALGVTPADVGLKGKTNEGMGWIGRGEGLACLAVATLVPLDG